MQLYGGKSVLQACKNVSGAIHKTLCGMDADNLAAIDDALIALDGTENKSILGANATLAVSMLVEDIIILAEPITGGVGGLVAPTISIFGNNLYQSGASVLPYALDASGPSELARMAKPNPSSNS